MAADTLLTWLVSRLDSDPPKAKITRNASRSFMLVLKVGTPPCANSASIACSVRGQIAADVRVKRIAAGIVLPSLAFSMLRTSLIAFTASAASSWLP